MKHKRLFITLTAVFSVVIALAIFLITWFWADSYEDFEPFRQEFEIPDLKSGATPQGIGNYYNGKYEVTVTDEDGNPAAEQRTQNYFFISAYFKNAPSRIYVVGEKTGYSGYVTVKNIDGTDYAGHCGGIATNGNFLWISSDDTVFVAKTADTKVYTNIAQEIIAKASAGGENAYINFTASFAANCNASFLYYYDADGEAGAPSSSDRLYVGEFYRKGNYETKETHRFKTPAGDWNTALAYEYSVSTSSLATNMTGLSCVAADNLAPEFANRVPKIQYAYSITDEIQGFARVPDTSADKKDKLVLSQSYGLKNSKLFYYDWSKIADNKKRKLFRNEEVAGTAFEYDGVKRASGAPYKDENLYVYFIDSSAYADEKKPYYSVPSMSEGLCVSGDRVYVLFESGSTKYKTFVRQILRNVFSFIPPKWD